MSIPKEPRQLMINLMYLVLTALLALNVSAEIFNAFKLVDDGLVKSNRTLESTNSLIPDQINELANKNRERYGVYYENSLKAREISKEFIDYVQGIKTYLIEEAGGMDPEKGQPVKYKDKDITTRYLVGQDPNKNEGKGGELELKISETAQKFLSLVDPEDRDMFAQRITLVVDDSWKNTKKKNWAHYNFFQMPVLSVLPIFSKIENDTRSTEAALLNYFLDKTGGKTIEFDTYRLVSSPKKSYIIAGEQYETEIFLSAAASNPGGVRMSINGANVPVQDGVAKYTVNTSQTGVQAYNVAAVITNPVTGEETNVGPTRFEFEVGRRSASVQLDMMNVFYIGVENPITVSAAGVSSNDLRVTGSGAGISLSPSGPGKYIVKVTQPGTATLTLSGGGLQNTTYDFRVKRIPDPTPKVARMKGGALSSAEMRVQPGMIAELEGFDFDARCSIEAFRVIRTRRGEDPALAENSGAAFGDAVKRIINDARPGDQYIFTDVRAKCPGDAASRTLNALFFTIR
jgi:gliding motility-associated protein GldM